MRKAKDTIVKAQKKIKVEKAFLLLRWRKGNGLSYRITETKPSTATQTFKGTLEVLTSSSTLIS